jgi:anti-sigma B factor antagonist
VSLQLSDYEVDAETHVIELGGDVDLYSAPAFKERLAEIIDGGKRRVVLDLSQATLFDSSALGALVGGVNRLQPRGGSLALVVTDESLHELFDITGLDRAFPIHGTREEALAALMADGDT